jgi:hypothetical protein
MLQKGISYFCNWPRPWQKIPVLPTECFTAQHDMQCLSDYWRRVVASPTFRRLQYSVCDLFCLTTRTLSWCAEINAMSTKKCSSTSFSDGRIFMPAVLSSVEHKYYKVEPVLRIFSKFCVYTRTPRLAQQLRSGGSGASRISRKSGLSTHMVKYMCMYKEAQLKSQHQHTGT